MSEKGKVSNAFMTFINEAPEYQEAWMEAIQKLGQVNKLDEKTQEIAYISVLACSRLESGIPFHVKHAKALGATRDEIIGAILVGLPAVGHAVIQSLPIALEAYDNE